MKIILVEGRLADRQRIGTVISTIRPVLLTIVPVVDSTYSPMIS